MVKIFKSEIRQMQNMRTSKIISAGEEFSLYRCYRLGKQNFSKPAISQSNPFFPDQPKTK